MPTVKHETILDDLYRQLHDPGNSRQTHGMLERKLSWYLCIYDKLCTRSNGALLVQ